MARHSNKIIAADDADDDVISRLDAEDRDAEVAETEVLDADDMYDIESEARGERERGERRLAARGDKSAKGKGVKEVSKSAKDDEWRPANTLDAPPARPGMVQRWIRYLSPGERAENDPKNWSRAMREGWMPRSLDTVPDGYDAPTGRHPSHGAVIVIGDLILCEMPAARFKSRRKFFRDKLERQLAAIQKRPLQEVESGRGPRISVTNKQDVTFGRRRRAEATDEG